MRVPSPAPSPKGRSFLAGALIGNSVPHLASAAANRRHLTPLAGRDSSPGVNLVWAAANLVAGAALLRGANPSAGGSERWDERLPAFEAGALTIATWMFMTEWRLSVNHGSAGAQGSD